MHTHPTRTLLILLAGLLVIAGLAYALRLSFSTPAQPATPTYGTFPAEAPPPKPQDYVAAQKGFQYLVSYTNKGFAPATLSVKKGETVRFTNNADTPLTLAISGTQVASLARAEYVEYTFNKAGTFDYSNGTTSGVVTVK